MPFAQKTAVAINLNWPSEQIVNALKSLDFIQNTQLHFVNINLTTMYALGLGEGSIVYPLQEDQNKIRLASIQALKAIAFSLFPAHVCNKIIFECLFSDDPKRKFCAYLTENKIDTAIVVARKKRGFFESSFSHYLSKHSDANLIILKHQQETD